MTLCVTGHRLSLPSSCLRPLIQNVKNFLSAKNGWAYLSWHYVCDTIDREYNINTLVEFASHTIIIMTVILLYVCVTRAPCFKEDFWARERNRDFWDTWGETTLHKVLSSQVYMYWLALWVGKNLLRMRGTEQGVILDCWLLDSCWFSCSNFSKPNQNSINYIPTYPALAG